jgi:hypothetical protein
MSKPSFMLELELAAKALQEKKVKAQTEKKAMRHAIWLKRVEESKRTHKPQRPIDGKRRPPKKVRRLLAEKRPMPYKEYLLTKWWRQRRTKKLRNTRGKCERCGGHATQVHHKHYRSLWKEKDKDLESICEPCHKRHHEALVQADNHLAAIARQKA